MTDRVRGAPPADAAPTLFSASAQRRQHGGMNVTFDYGLERGKDRRDEAMRRIEREGDRWSATTLAQAIRAFAATGREFSASDLRGLVAEPVSPAQWGVEFHGSALRGEIEQVGYRKSRTESRRGGVQAVWRGTAAFIAQERARGSTASGGTDSRTAWPTPGVGRD